MTLDQHGTPNPDGDAERDRWVATSVRGKTHYVRNTLHHTYRIKPHLAPPPTSVALYIDGIRRAIFTTVDDAIAAAQLVEEMANP